MSETKIHFETLHEPALPAGEYTLSADLTGTTEPFNGVLSPEKSLKIAVQGPRYFLPSPMVQAVFPPREGLGEYDNVIPHVELQRTTLPWERNGVQEDTPWVALLLLQEDELNDPKIAKVEQKSWSELRVEVGLDHELGEEEGTLKQKKSPEKAAPSKATGLYLEKEFFEAIAPSVADIKLSAHVRVKDTGDGQQETGRAVVITNRLPRPGSRATVHLVSLENFKMDTNEKLALKGDLPGDGMVPLISLMSWSFSCLEILEYKVSEKAKEKLNSLPDEKFSKLKNQLGKLKDINVDTLFRSKEALIDALKEKEFAFDSLSEEEKKAILSACQIDGYTFKGILNKLDIGWLRNENKDSPFFELGSVPVRHELRQGGQTVSWYRGPLVAGAEPGNKLKFELPVRNADELLLYDEDSKMLDTSYAAAWQLGRLLSIGDRSLSQTIARWKIMHARQAAKVEQQLFAVHIPFTDPHADATDESAILDTLDDYFSGLKLLKGLPFQYLVPHESMLPDESLRLFYLDQCWIGALLDGAFSIGRTTEHDLNLEQERKKNSGLALLQANAGGPMMGILLRSDLVAGWPSTLVEGFSDEDSNQKLEALRFEHLGPDVLLVLFAAGELKKITIHLPAQSLHFGFSRPSDDQEPYFKELKDLKTGKEIVDEEATLPWKIKEIPNFRVFSPTEFIDNITDEQKQKIKLSGSNFNSAYLAIELLEGVPKLVVNVNPS